MNDQLQPFWDWPLPRFPFTHGVSRYAYQIGKPLSAEAKRLAGGLEGGADVDFAAFEKPLFDPRLLSRMDG